MSVDIGQSAPDFKLTTHLEQTVKLSNYRGKHIVLAFFPQAWTPI
jgi:peroxiredoxin Q/BCP